MKMKDHVNLYQHFLICEFEKPMYEHENYGIVRLDKKWVDFAIHNFVNIVIRLPKGEKTFFPKQLKREGLKVKEVFLRPNEPMTLYELAIQNGEKQDIERWIEG